MSFIGNLFNPAQGAGFTAQSANLQQNPNLLPQAQQAQQQVQQGVEDQGSFVNALQAQNGIGNQSAVFNQLQGVANGQGPNPAQAMLANATGANTANQAALMAGQRGAGANTGLIARQAAQQGAANQQNAIGQGAALQANQSLGALNQLGGIAGQQVGQQAGAIQGLNAAAQGNQGQLMNAMQGQNQLQVANTAQQNQANASIADTNAQKQGDIFSGIIGGLGAGASVLSGGGGLGAAGKAAFAAEGGEIQSVLGEHASMMAKGGKAGKVPAMLSPGEKIIPKKDVKAVAQGKKDPMKAKTVPGVPPVGGDKNDLSNDIVPADLNEGDVILPRSVTQAKNPHWAAHAFVSKIMAQNGMSTRKAK